MTIQDALGPKPLRECPFCGSEATSDLDLNASCSSEACPAYHLVLVNPNVWNQRAYDAELKALREQNAVMREALERIADENKPDAIPRRQIARDALAKIGGGK